MSISVALIAHNEEENLDATLESVGWADEIVLVDCGSTDSTAAVARKYTDRVFTRPNLSNLNVNKNFSFDQTTSDWILCLDADEIVPAALASEIVRTTGSNPRERGFYLKRHNRWFGRILMHGGHFPDRQLRLFRRGEGRFPEQHVHERLDVKGEVGMLEVPLEHHPYPTLSRYLEKMNFYSTFEAERLFAEGKRFSADFFFIELIRGTFRFARRYLLKGGFLDGWQGFAAAYLDLFSRMTVQIKLRELRKTR